MSQKFKKNGKNNMKIKHPLVKGKVKLLYPNIYGVVVDDYYDRAMLFCRYQ